MKCVSAFILLAITSLFSGCASTQYFSAAPHAGQILVAVPPAKIIFGVQEIRDGVQSEVLFQPTAENKLLNGTAVFWVFTKNLDRAPFQFSATNIRVVDKVGRAVEVLTIDKLAQKLQANKTKQEFGYLIISSMASALAAAPYMTTQQTGSYSGYTSNGQYVTGSYAGTQQNTTVAFMAQQENSARSGVFNNQMEEAYQRAMGSIQQLSLKGVQLERGQKIEGIVTVPLPPPHSLPNRYHFVITIDNNSYEYDFPISKSSK